MIVVNNELHGHQIMEECVGNFTPGLDTVIARVAADGSLMGGACFTAHTGRSCQMHQASFAPNWISRDLLWACFHYPFEQLGYDCVLGLCRAKNHQAIDVNKKYGFKTVAEIKAVYPGDDLVIMQMMKHECRWLAIKPRELRVGG